MKWNTVFYDYGEGFWLERTEFLFGTYLEHKILIETKCIKNRTTNEKSYYISCGFVFHKPHTDTSYRMGFKANNELISRFSEYEGKTHYGWWCTKFRFTNLETAMTLLENIIIFFEDYYHDYIPENFKEVS